MVGLLNVLDGMEKYEWKYIEKKATIIHFESIDGKMDGHERTNEEIVSYLKKQHLGTTKSSCKIDN